MVGFRVLSTREEAEMHTGVWFQNMKLTDCLADLHLIRRIILKRTVKQRIRKRALDASRAGLGPVAFFCKHGNEKRSP